MIFAPIRDKLADMYPLAIDALASVENESGDPVPTGVGDFLALPCRVSMKNRMIRSANGTVIASSYKVTVNSTAAIDVENFVYNLPPEVPGPRTQLEAISIHSPQDQNGVHHRVLFFP